MTAVRRGHVMVTIGLGILDGEEILESEMPIVRETDEIDGSNGPFAQVCQVFEARERKKGK
jgi:hypothetical protein